MKIDMIKYRGNSSPSYTGRSEGLSARKDANLDIFDKDNKRYIFLIPEGTTAFNPSFFLGFFFNSIKAMGVDKFRRKYIIKIMEEDEELKRHLKIDISEGIRHSVNQINSKTTGGGLLSFLNFTHR